MQRVNDYLQLALQQAEQALTKGEVPVGAVIVDSRNGNILAQAHNRTETLHDPTAHAEIVSLREACAKEGSVRLPYADMYVTLEPCAMCAAAISHARLRRLYYGAFDSKGGGVDHGARVFQQKTCHHTPEVYSGIEEEACADLLRRFFRSKRD